MCFRKIEFKGKNGKSYFLVKKYLGIQWIQEFSGDDIDLCYLIPKNV